MKKFIGMLAAVVGMTAAAQAQDFTVQYRWVAKTTPVSGGMLGSQLADGTVVSGGILNVTSAYRQRFDLEVKVLRNDGDDNGGFAAVIGDIDVTNAQNGADTLLHNHRGIGAFTSTLGNRSPFTVSSDTAVPWLNGIHSPLTTLDVDGLHNIQPSINPAISKLWNPGEAIPPLPDPAGADVWVPIYRVLIDVSESELDGTRAAIGFRSHISIVVDQWFSEPLGNPPEEEPVEVIYRPRTVFLDSAILTSFQIQLAPAPASAALLCMGGLAVARRRRK